MAEPRIAVAAVDVARALGAVDAVDVEARLPEGAPQSLFHAFRVAQPAPHRPLWVRVFPYSGGSWSQAIETAIAVDVSAWRAIWAHVRTLRDANGVYSLAPEVRATDRVVRRIAVGELVGMARPQVEWPDLARAALPDERASSRYQTFCNLVAEVVSPAVKSEVGVVVKMPAWSDLGDARRRMLTDGHLMLATTYRGFVAELSALDRARARTRATAA